MKCFGCCLIGTLGCMGLLYNWLYVNLWDGPPWAWSSSWCMRVRSCRDRLSGNVWFWFWFKVKFWGWRKFCWLMFKGMFWFVFWLRFWFRFWLMLGCVWLRFWFTLDCVWLTFWCWVWFCICWMDYCRSCCWLIFCWLRFWFKFWLCCNCCRRFCWLVLGNVLANVWMLWIGWGVNVLA